MKQWMTCKEAAEKWNLGEHWISILCQSGAIAGAKKKEDNGVFRLMQSHPSINVLKNAII